MLDVLTIGRIGVDDSHARVVNSLRNRNRRASAPKGEDR